MKVNKNRIRFIVDIVDHCNLNCKCCGHFSPLAPKNYLSLESFERDLKRLYELLDGDIYCFEIMGGEALLHPRINDFILLLSKYVKGEKFVCTNGLLLPSMPDSFYELCAKTNTTISITRYPINLDWNEINKKVMLYGTNIYQIKSKGSQTKKWYRNKRDLSGNQDMLLNFHKCFWKCRCIVLQHGRLSSCVVPFKAKFFQTYYNSKAFDTSEFNSIDIYSAQSIEEIVNFLNKPIPCCRYCLPNQEQEIPWGISKKEITEWF